MSPNGWAFLVILFTFGSCESIRPICETDDCKKTADRILSYMDPSVRPCDDFYKFACGKFLETAELRDDTTQNSSFIQVSDILEDQLKAIVFEESRPDEPYPYQTMKHLFSLCLDEDKIDARGVSPAVSRLAAAGGWPVLGNWSEFGWSFLDTEIRLRNLSIGGGSLFQISVSIDAKNTSKRVIEIDQAGLGLPREFLVKGLSDPIVQAYYSYMVDIAEMYGADRRLAQVKLNESLMFEIELAKITVPREQRRDFERMYNPYGLEDLMAEFGWVNWAALLESMMPASVQLRKNELIIVNEVEFLKKLEVFLQKYSDEVIANYMMWQAAGDMTDILTNQMRNRKMEYRRATVGIAAREPRWKECIGVASSLSLALSSLYVERYFDETSKKAALNMTNMIREEIIRDIQELDWMDEETKKRAVYKASQVVQHIGYPDELTDMNKIEEFYKGLDIDKDQYFEALIDLSRWANDYKFRQLREEVNRTDWRSHGTVTMVNAFYNPMENSMQFPAGILQQPFFSARIPQYVSYARIGFIVGHEITHGFDDQGSQFDYKGDLDEWWGKESKENFKKKTMCMINQYASYKESQTQLNLNGINTQGENVADNGGYKLAYLAYHRMADQLMEPEPGLPNLEQYSNDQLFLISTANLWCTRYRPEALRMLITTDPHSPAEFRVNGVMKNFPEFSKVFQCGPGDAMNPENKCAVW
ncbi:neprilysin-2-like isoform X2 [Homalodisca vitripennis]|uniref:neprilysin-2-like isoform X2 n=1 Tax=Homalodisca vitripennis TaxID=197043 RepID=UPI001EEBDC88|nr:neprilysin-2-like isoform X2 [Homalodisca vitripennis]